MGDYKNIKVKSNTRFILMIDENFENVRLKDLADLHERLTATECAEILEKGLDEVKIIAGLLENKLEENERIKNKENTFRKLKIIK